MSDDQPRDEQGRFAGAGGTTGLKAWSGKQMSKKDHAARGDHFAKAASEAERDGNHDWAATNHHNAASAYEKAGKTAKAEQHRNAARSATFNADKFGNNPMIRQAAMRSIDDTLGKYR